MAHNGSIKIVINLTDKNLFSHLQHHIFYPDVEMFYFPQITEITQIVEKINPQIIVVEVDEVFLKNEKILNFFKSFATRDIWSFFVLTSQFPSSKLGSLAEIKKSILCPDIQNREFIAFNLNTIIKEEKYDQERLRQQRYTQNMLACLKVIEREDSIPNLFEKLIHSLPKILPYDYWALFSFDPQYGQVANFKQFIPPLKRYAAILTPNLEKLSEIWMKRDRKFQVDINKDPQLFKKLEEWGWSVNQLYFLPIRMDKLAIGGILLGNSLTGDMDNSDRRFLDEISGLLARKVYDSLQKEKVQEEFDDFAEQLIYNRFSEDAILQLSCKKINEVARAESSIFWQINRGFGFLFPKFSYFRENHAQWKSLEKNLIFLSKDNYLNQIISSKRAFLLDAINVNGEFGKATKQTFEKLGYHNLLVAPVLVQNDEIGLFVANRGKDEASFSAWELDQVNALLDKLQKVLADTHVIKDANFKLKQLSRIFELGNEIKLDLNLVDILAHILTSIRKTLGWNDVAILQSNKFKKNYSLVRKIGFDKSQNLPFNFFNNVSFTDFGNFLVKCKAISGAYFYDSHPAGNSKSGSKPMETESEWHDDDLLVVPIETQKNSLGFFVVRDPVDRLKPTADNVVSLEYFANQAAVAIENSLLYENLLASEERYRSLAETMTLGLVTCSAVGKILYVNPAFERLVGLNQKALLKQKLTNFYSRESQNRLMEISNLVLRKEDENKRHFENEELELISTSGETIPVSTFAFPFYQQRHKIGFFLVHNDLRVIKKLERLKSDFNSMIVHDLRSPMNVIQGFIELIRTRVVGEINSEQEELLDIAKENVKKVLTLVDNFLVASKLEVGKFSIDPKVSEIHSLIERIIENHRVLMSNNNVILESELNQNLPLLFFDSLRLEQVLNNLLSNAIKFTPEGGKVQVTTDLFPKKIKGEEKMFARIGVHDTGPGIPDDNLKNVFEKYEQVDSEVSLKSMGTGLGLSICKEIVNLHGGDIWVESEVGKGSHFYFTLPIEPSIDKLLK